MNKKTAPITLPLVHYYYYGTCTLVLNNCNIIHMYYKLKVSKLMHNKFLVPYLIAGNVNIIALGKGNAGKRNTGFITATVNGGILNPKIYSARPGDQCQAQQAVCSINQSVFSTLVWLPPPCGIVGLPF